ncbi:MAG: methyltransferase domain-containing protein [Acidobacteria bacterium]|nr:methyltransferase domain-containing protein [Acidobacteriota bacterium]
MTRLWAYPGRNQSARARWEYIGRSRSDATYMMNGSGDEDDLCRGGGRMARAIAAALGITRDQRVLEVGCGLGRVGREMAPLCATYTGADISRSLLHRAARRTRHLRNVTLRHLARHGDADDGLHGLEDGAWDRIYCHLVLLHLDEVDVLSLLRGIRRVLAADGLVYFDVWNGHHPHVKELSLHEKSDPSLRRQPHRSRFYSRPEVEGWLAAAALTALWMSDESFLVQVVATQPGCSPTVLAASGQILALNAAQLIPRGRLNFSAPDDDGVSHAEKSRGAGTAKS